MLRSAARARDPMTLDQIVEQAGPFLVPLLAAASLVEYVFPPFPGDSIVLAGAALAVRGDVPIWQVMVATTLGSLLGSYLDYRFGVWLGPRLEHPSNARFRKFLTHERLAKLEERYRKYGPWLILGNRFVPVARAVFFIFAGISGISMKRTLVLGTISAVAWNALLIALGWSVGANLDRLKALVATYSKAAVAIALVLVLGWVLVTLVRRRRAARATDDAAP